MPGTRMAGHPCTTPHKRAAETQFSCWWRMVQTLRLLMLRVARRRWSWQRTRVFVAICVGPPPPLPPLLHPQLLLQLLLQDRQQVAPEGVAGAAVTPVAVVMAVGAQVGSADQNLQSHHHIRCHGHCHRCQCPLCLPWPNLCRSLAGEFRVP